MPKSEFDHLYKPADKYFVINNLDEDSEDIPISLPSPPDITLIDGYGLHPDEQYFRRLKVPSKLISLERRVLDRLKEKQKGNQQKAVTGYKLMTTFWGEIESDIESYEAEIEFIRKVWYHRFKGYWFFNDGKPTYISGRHFMFLNFFNLPDIKSNNGYPEYRDRHRREFLFRDYLRNTHEAFADKDEKGYAALKDGKYAIKDIGIRLFYGDIHPKSRRNGSTIMSINDMVEDAEIKRGAYSTIVSKDGKATEDHWNKTLLPFWSSRPMFLRPIWDGGNRPNVIKYFTPRNVFGEESLGSTIDFVDSAGEVKKDGDKISGFLCCDEEGKVSTSIDVLSRWSVYKRAMALGDGTDIIAYSSHISTVEEMSESGSAFLRMMELSNFYQRDDHGNTMSGLAMMFFPAYDGQEGFIDRFGMSVIGTPTERQKSLRKDAKYAKLNKGAKQWQQETRDALLKQGTPAAMQEYRQYVKKFPWRSSECWYGTAGNMGWDLEAIDQRGTEIRKLKTAGRHDVRRGKFMWENGRRDTKVIFVEDKENGKFLVDYQFLKNFMRLGLDNQRQSRWEWNFETGTNDLVYEPLRKSTFTTGADPFRFDNKRDVQLREGRVRQSDGGIATKWEHDSSVDTSDNREEWDSDRFICVYRYRCEQDEYNEDVLMCNIFWGGLCYPEQNVDSVWRHYIKRGYKGYLKYDIDPNTGKIAQKPGRYLTKEAIIELLSETAEYVKYRVHKEMFEEYLSELKSIKGPEDLTNHDLLSACGMALLGSKSSYASLWERTESDSVDAKDFDVFF